MPGSRSSSALTSCVLPPPEGAATTKRLPARCARTPGGAWSFEVLHLLAHLLDQHLELERHLRQLGVDRLRAERVGFAVQLLREEIEALADAAALRSTRRNSLTCVVSRASSSATSILRREQRELLLQPLVVRARAPLRAAAPPSFSMYAACSAGMRGVDARDLRLDVASQRASSTARELRAFARARGVELGQRVLDERVAPARRAPPARRSLGDHAGPAQDVGDRQRRRAGNARATRRRRRRRAAATRSTLIAMPPAAPTVRDERDAALDLAALLRARRAARAAPARACAARRAA